MTLKLELGKLEKIRDIRSSEKVFWRKILDIYATSIDYDRKSPITIKFFNSSVILVYLLCLVTLIISIL